jgi:integrase
MRAEERKRANGALYYSFIYFDGHKKIRLKQSDHPKFDNLGDAQKWALAKTAEHDSLKARALKRLEWKNKYYQFNELADDYIEYCKKSQPNSWTNTRFYLHHYVLPFFLNIKDANNPNSWTLYFEEFKDWLEDCAVTIKQPQEIIAYSSKNHCIKTLNTFLSYLLKKNLVNPSNIHKLSGFAKHKLNTREADDLISFEEYQSIYNNLLEINESVAILYQTAYYTGMRFNEIYGLSMDSLFIGDIDDLVLSKALSDHQIEYFGYIILTDQPANKSRKRQSNGTIKRKPLKSQKKISEKNSRIIPITSKDHFNNLVKLYKTQDGNYQNRKYGSDRKNYVLFDNLSPSECNRSLRLVYEKSKYIYKSYHCCRHTRCTELVGLTRDFVLTKYWLGHSRQETTLRYTHIYQQSVREAIKKKQQIDFIN